MNTYAVGASMTPTSSSDSLDMLLEALAEHGDGDWVDRQSAVLMGLGVLAHLLARADEVAERDVH